MLDYATLQGTGKFRCILFKAFLGVLRNWCLHIQTIVDIVFAVRTSLGRLREWRNFLHHAAWRDEWWHFNGRKRAKLVILHGDTGCDCKGTLSLICPIVVGFYWPLERLDSPLAPAVITDGCCRDAVSRFRLQHEIDIRFGLLELFLGLLVCLCLFIFEGYYKVTQTILIVEWSSQE